MLLCRTFRSARFLIKGPIILVILLVVNAMTYHGEWWVKWAALGIGIAWMLALLRVLRAVALVGGLAALFAYFRKRP